MSGLRASGPGWKVRVQRRDGYVEFPHCRLHFGLADVTASVEADEILVLVLSPTIELRLRADETQLEAIREVAAVVQADPPTSRRPTLRGSLGGSSSKDRNVRPAAEPSVPGMSVEPTPEGAPPPPATTAAAAAAGVAVAQPSPTPPEAEVGTEPEAPEPAPEPVPVVAKAEPVAEPVPEPFRRPSVALELPPDHPDVLIIAPLPLTLQLLRDPPAELRPGTAPAAEPSDAGSDTDTDTDTDTPAL